MLEKHRSEYLSWIHAMIAKLAVDVFTQPAVGYSGNLLRTVVAG